MTPVPPKIRPIHTPRPWWDVYQPALDACGVLTALAAVAMAQKGYVDDDVLILGLVSAIVFLIAGRFTGLHRASHIDSVDEEVASVAMTWLATVAVMASIAFLTRTSELYLRSVVFAWLLLTPAVIGVCRMATRIVHHGLLRRGIGVRRVAIAGVNQLGLQAEANLRGDTGLGWNLIGYYDDRQINRDGNQSQYSQLLGDWEQMVADARAGHIDTILITLPMRAEERIRQVLDKLSDTTVSVYVIPDIFVFELLHSSWKSIGGLPAVSIFENPLRGIDGFGKRITDFVLALVGLVVVAIPMVAIALLIKLTSRGPVFFRQKRYGLDGEEIRVWKFRTMHTCEDGAVIRQATKNDSRITKVGGVLRRTSLDELPQLFNVLDGSMSLVGPRPHATAHNELYRGQIRGYMLRHKVKPGITGLAQVNGCRGETDTLDKMRRRVEFDHEYIRGWSLWLDLRILMRTVMVAWRQTEAY